MGVVLRLLRIGAKKKPAYRIVAADSRRSCSGSYLESVGHYDPNRPSNKCVIKQDRLNHWVSNGALISDRVKSILRNNPAQPDTVASISNENNEGAD
ncbi:MAG: 30S ribosomal protein S16 [Nitrospinota bacterium]